MTPRSPGGPGTSGRVRTLIIGAGLTGLSAAYHLELRREDNYLLVERDLHVGGLARTETVGGFAFDHAIHVLYTADRYVAELVCDRLLAGNLSRQRRQSYCYTAGRYTPYPYQAHTFGLPAEIIAENLLGLIEAERALGRNGPAPHFEAWILQTFGSGIAQHFMIPYNERQWAWDLRDMGYDWIADRVPMPDLREVIHGALGPPNRQYGPNREFWYPERGGIGALALAFARAVPPARLRLGTRVESIDGRLCEARLSDGGRVRYERLISTIPLPSLVSMLGKDAPADVRRAAARLRSNTVHTVNLGFRGQELGTPVPVHWAYFPEEHTAFHRLSFPHAFSASMVPPGCCSIQAEISESAVRPRDRGKLIEETLQGLVRIGILDPADVRPVAAGGRLAVACMVTLDPAYVIYDLAHRANTGVVTGRLAELQIETRGRFGEWKYLNMDEAILRGRDAAEACR